MPCPTNFGRSTALKFIEIFLYRQLFVLYTIIAFSVQISNIIPIVKRCVSVPGSVVSSFVSDSIGERDTEQLYRT